MEELIHLLALRNIKGIGDIIARRLLNRFGSPISVFKANTDTLIDVEGVNKTLARSILNYSDWDNNKREAEIINKKEIKIVKFNDPEYPRNLKNIYNYPLFLYYIGQIRKENDIALAVVGSRDCDDYGIKVTEKIVNQLSDCGITIISGMARGIDTAAHKAALKYGGKTVAVLGNGVDICYPYENNELYKAITSGGYVASEYSVGTKPESMNFPRRNRLISGLSLGVIVIQANRNSGALITADYANEQNREVFAIPGNITNRRNSGTNQLIKNGAKLVDNIKDIVEEISDFSTLSVKTGTEKRTRPDIKGDEAVIFRHLLESKLHIDQIAQLTNIDITRLFSLLLSMEMKGIIKSLPGNYYKAA